MEEGDLPFIFPPSCQAECLWDDVLRNEPFQKQKELLPPEPVLCRSFTLSVE